MLVIEFEPKEKTTVSCTPGAVGREGPAAFSGLFCLLQLEPYLLSYVNPPPTLQEPCQSL